MLPACKRFVNGPFETGNPLYWRGPCAFPSTLMRSAQHLTGNETYIRNLLNCFDVAGSRSGFRGLHFARRGHRRSARTISQETGLGAIRLCGWATIFRGGLREDRPSLLHVQYTAPLFCSVPVVVSVHDVSFLEHPEYFTSFPRPAIALDGAPHGESGFVRADAQRILQAANSGCLPASRRQGGGDAERRQFGVSSSGARDGAARACELALPPVPFILTVGDLQPRKNHLGLIRAFEELIAAHPQLPHHLVMVGKETWYAPTVLRGREEIAAWRIASTSPVSWTTRSCCGCTAPAICSFIRPSTKASDCRFWKPWRADARWLAPTLRRCRRWPIRPRCCSIRIRDAEMVFAMRDLLLNPELRLRMERLGVQRAAMFSWESSAAKTLDVYYEVAGEASKAPRASPISAVPCSPMKHRGTP